MKKISIVARLIGLTYKKTRLTGDHFIAALFRMFYQLIFKKCAPGELAKYAPHLPSQAVKYPFFISKENSLAKLERFNDPKQQKLTEDKDVFYRICRENDLRVPRHLLTSTPGDEGLEKIREMLTADGGERAVYDYFPDHFIKKDKNGAYASGFEVFKKQDGQIVSSNGRCYGPGAFIDYLTDPNAVPCVVQQRLFGHRDLVRLSATRVTQGVRLTTLWINEKKPRPGWFQLKVVSGDNITDNYKDGYEGNLLGYGDLLSGILAGGVIGSSDGMGIEGVSHHPISGIALKDFQIPCWQEALDLACRAHTVFSRFGVIGWDIAVTDDGPVILEGNVWTDPPLSTASTMAIRDWELVFG